MDFDPTTNDRNSFGPAGHDFPPGEWIFHVTPWERAFLHKVTCTKRILRIACPFIKVRNIRLILSSFRCDQTLPLELRVITRLNVRDLRARVHDLAVLQLLLNNPIPGRCNIDLRVDNALHAKLYIFDDVLTIVSSSNLSYAAFYRNHEVGIATTQLEMVRSSVDHFESLFRGARPVTNGQIDEMRCKLRVLAPVLIDLDSEDLVEPELAVVDDESDPVPLDPVVIEAIDASLEEQLSEDLMKEIVSVEETTSAQEAVDALCEHRFYEDVLSRFQSVFGSPFPNVEDLATLYAHPSAYKSLKVAKPNRVRADLLENMGRHALNVAIVRLIFEASNATTDGESISTKLAFICRSDHLVAQLNQLGLSRAIVGRSVSHSGDADSTARKRAAAGIAAAIAHRIIGYLFETRHWDEFLSTMRQLLRLRDEFPFESYRNERFKGRLQQICQRDYGSAPRYEVLSSEGPDHDLLFAVRVYGGKKNTKPLAEGLGRTKKQAETDAAYKAINLFKDRSDDLAIPPACHRALENQPLMGAYLRFKTSQSFRVVTLVNSIFYTRICRRWRTCFAWPNRSSAERNCRFSLTFLLGLSSPFVAVAGPGGCFGWF